MKFSAKLPKYTSPDVIAMQMKRTSFGLVDPTYRDYQVVYDHKFRHETRHRQKDTKHDIDRKRYEDMERGDVEERTHRKKPKDHFHEHKKIMVT